MKRILVTLLVSLALPVAVLAQSASMMAMAQAELNKRGLNETEVRARLLENGIDVDNIQPSEYANYQTRVLAILDQMQAEKANANGGTTVIVESPAATTPATGTEIPPTGTPAGAAETGAQAPQTTAGEAAAESALQSALADNGVSPTAGNDIYGHSLFTGTSMDVFRTTDGAQAPDTYIL